MNLYDFLNKKKIDFHIYPHEEVYDSQRLAHVLRIPGHNVAKAVMISADHGYLDVIAVVPATAQVDLKRVSAALGGAEVRLATKDEVASRCPECEYGVLPPFGSCFNMKTLVDRSLGEHEDLFFQGCNRHEAIRLKYSDFCTLENPVVATISRQSPGEQATRRETTGRYQG